MEKYLLKTTTNPLLQHHYIGKVGEGERNNVHHDLFQ